MIYVEFKQENNVVIFKEITEQISFDSTGFLVRGNYKSKCYISIESKNPCKALKELKDKIYDVMASRFENWDVEISFDWLRFGLEGNDKNFYKPISAYATIIE